MSRTENGWRASSAMMMDGAAEQHATANAAVRKRIGRGGAGNLIRDLQQESKCVSGPRLSIDMAALCQAARPGPQLDAVETSGLWVRLLQGVEGERRDAEDQHRAVQQDRASVQRVEACLGVLVAGRPFVGRKSQARLRRLRQDDSPGVDDDPGHQPEE